MSDVRRDVGRFVTEDDSELAVEQLAADGRAIDRAGRQVEQRPDEVAQQVVGEVAAVRDAAALDPESARQTGGIGRRGDALPQLGHQATLADARLADEQRDAPTSGADQLVQSQQLLELGVPADHRALDADGLPGRASAPAAHAAR